MRTTLLAFLGLGLIGGCGASPGGGGGGGRSTAGESDAGDLETGAPVPDDDGADGQAAGDSGDTNDDDEAAVSLDDIQAATWLVLSGNESSNITATAFAVGPDLLATNAHVVDGVLQTAPLVGAAAVVIQNETGDWRSISTVWKHSEYVGESIPSPDVGLIRVDRDLPTHLTLADTRSLEELEVFDDVSLCGFPGDIIPLDLLNLELTGEFRPFVTCLQGTVSQLRPFPGDTSPDAGEYMIQHDMPTMAGTSGSAVFNNAGEVIGVHALGFSNEGEYNFAIRADKLTELIDAVMDGEDGGIDLADWDGPPAGDDGSDSPDLSGYPRGIIEPCAGCDCICIQWLPDGDIFCDSDCDGYEDSIELDFGFDVCNPFDPPLVNPSPLTVCEDLILFGLLDQ